MTQPVEQQNEISQPYDGDAIDAAYRRERVRLLHYFRRNRQELEDAQDLLQDVFLRLVGTGTPSAIFNTGAFLQRIARNLLINRENHLMRWRKVIISRDLDGIQVGIAPDQDQWIEVENIMEQYRLALSRMPERTRLIFELHRVDELTYVQISERLEVSVKTVEYHIASALKHLDKSLDRG